MEPQSKRYHPHGKALRRRFSANYKLKVLREADACAKRGELGAYLRREGLYSSLLVEIWRRLREKGALDALKARPRGPKSSEVDTPLSQENHRLRAENDQLQARLQQAQAIIKIQKKSRNSCGFP